MEFQDVTPQLEKLASEFQYKDPPDFLIRLQELVSYILRAIADFLKQFKISLPGMADTSAVGNVMQVLIVIIGVICLILVLILMSSRMKHLRAQANLAKRGASSLEEILDSAGWKLKGEELARERLFKDACRAVYLSVIYALDEKKILAFTPTRSNYEYFYALHGKQGLQTGFRKLADLVEEMWFGNLHAAQEDYDNCVQISNSLEQDLAYFAEKVEATP
jgi:hypothetical protein